MLLVFLKCLGAFWLVGRLLVSGVLCVCLFGVELVSGVWGVCGFWLFGVFMVVEIVVSYNPPPHPFVMC